MKKAKLISNLNCTRKAFLAGGAALAGLAAAGAPVGRRDPTPPSSADAESERGIRVLFLGSGAAGWTPEMAKRGSRRQSSVLLDRRVLIDFTPCSFDLLPKGCRPEALFQTHSHGDHYNPAAAVKVGVKRMYVHESWAQGATREVRAAAAKLGKPAPEIIALKFGVPVEEGGMTFTCVPSNHSTSRLTDGVLERTSMYLVEKGPARLVYATDTGGILGDAARMIGIDPHITLANYAKYQGAVRRPEAITAFIMEATDGDLDEDFRMFVHSSVQVVSRTVNSLIKNKRYLPPAGQSAYITHLAIKYRDWPSEKINAELPAPLKAAYDGLEVTLG